MIRHSRKTRQTATVQNTKTLNVARFKKLKTIIAMYNAAIQIPDVIANDLEFIA